jgi:predicted ATP-binding protein involved in virulence
MVRLGSEGPRAILGKGGWTVRIDTLKLNNFKKFHEAYFQFNPNFTVLIGENATGKTSILDALAILLGAYLLGSDVPVGRGGLKKEDARLLSIVKEGQSFLERQTEVYIAASGVLHGERIEWKRRAGGRAFAAKKLVGIGASDLNRVRQGEDVDIPLLLYYGAGRLWKTHSKVKIGRPESRLVGYRNCLDPKSDQFLFEKWFKQLELADLQQNRKTPALEAVRDAVKTCIPQAIRFFHDVAFDQPMIDLENLGLIPFNNLSDGYRNMAAMAADIAHRASRINPHLGSRAAKETTGVVLIDEIDLHLHPNWQRSVVGDLKEAFPKLQFIATTHSPFIIQSLQPGEVIDLNQEALQEQVEPVEAGNASPGPASSFSNRSIEDIVEDVMGVEVPQRSLRYQKMFEAAKEYYRILQEAKGADELKKEALKRKLDELSAPFSDDVAYHAFLEMERLAAGVACSKEPETEG